MQKFARDNPVEKSQAAVMGIDFSRILFTFTRHELVPRFAGGWEKTGAGSSGYHVFRDKTLVTENSIRSKADSKPQNRDFAAAPKFVEASASSK